ncbi:tripartite tricarboxylate transporter TctB family protein [Frigidibacter sp. MR17.24]|uniref:tripartite tricarboxylate transporter TctB family protein n=1 Tax=Frigidibacter sp. MR17.24 TaxID=3127345 RepID=UPI003012F0D0
MSDRIMGGIGLALSLFYIWAATIIPESFMADVIGPSTFPIIIGVLMAVCSLVFIARPDPDPVWPPLNRLAEIGFAILVCFLYAQLIDELGFAICTALASGYLCWRLGGTPVTAVLTGLGLAAGLYLIFKTILGLSLAAGPLGF